MASAQLYLPKKKPKPVAAQGIMTPAEYDSQQKLRREAAKQQEFAGRNVGKPHGTFVTDEAEQQMGVILCSQCDHKFDPVKYHYYKTREFKIQGRCDACREYTQGANFYIYEGLLGRKSGQCWWPR